MMTAKICRLNYIVLYLQKDKSKYIGYDNKFYNCTLQKDGYVSQILLAENLKKIDIKKGRENNECRTSLESNRNRSNPQVKLCE